MTEGAAVGCMPRAAYAAGAQDIVDQVGSGGDGILTRIVRRLPEFNSTEARLAEVVLKSPEAAAHMKLAAFARAAGVSQPTTIRFCRRLGRAGFSDFRIAIAQAAARGSLYVHREIRDDAPLADTVSRAAQQTGSEA